MPRLAPALLLATLATQLGGCGWLFGDEEGGDEGSPCVDDIVGCDDDTSQFMEDPSCTLTGDLDVVLGQGEDQFTALADGEVPDVEYGFQGGQHIWAAIQVRNPDLDRPQLKIRISADYCEGGCEQAGNWTTDNLRELVADPSTLTVTDEGWFEQTRMLVTVEPWAFASARRVQVLVTDPCGRQGVAVAQTAS